MEKETELATQAAAEATISATKAKDMFNEMRKSFEIEIANVQRISLQLQENFTLEKETIQSVVNKAHKTYEELSREKEQMWLVALAAQTKNLELNEFLKKESSNVVDAMIEVRKDRNIAFQAAKEAKCSALKASEVLAEVLKSFNEEMIKTCHVNMQLSEKLERKKEGIEREQKIVLQQSQEIQEQFSKELELAITSWKHAMNMEIAKAKEITFGLEEEQRRALLTINQTTMLYPQRESIQADMEEYISKTQEALDDLAKSIHQLQDVQEDKHQRLFVKRQELEQFKTTWQTELGQLQQMTRVLEKRFKESICEQSILGNRIEMVENVQVNLVQSYEDVRNSTGDLEKTAAIWLPKYETAARIVNELSSKVGRMDEQIKLTCHGGESLVQQIARIVESKVNEMKDMANTPLESRVNALEKSLSHDSNVSLKLEYIGKSGKDCGNKAKKMPSLNYLSESVEALQRRMEIIAAERNEMETLDSNEDFNSKIVDLDNRIEHVASATFTNLRLLDKKVEHVTKGVQSALDGATLADKKCASLGCELVKVFRMFTNKKDLQGLQDNCLFKKEGKVNKPSQSPVKRQHINGGQDVDSHSHSTIDAANKDIQDISKIIENDQSISTRINTSPRKIIKRGISNSSRDILHTKTTHPSQIQNPTFQHDKEQDIIDSNNFEGGSPSKNKTNRLQDTYIGVNECKLHRPLCVMDEHKTIVDTNVDGQLTIEKCQEGFPKNCQRTNIRLEAGRIHVNVSHRSSGLNQISEKRNDLIAVQS
ncbi:hypothetical protein KC19_5G056200 [Ceratodon purpureus]|uniref:Uncharacterized protein n=1 Tax=Ceratodon purpureus TaxID=3225 RepID=A0A8T0HZJ8_CERPU|nr:hypothetical protein KC19_5G056200 [Ceratodon purpureus]